jgi:DNA-binding PadR family transcriptional regulator
MSARHAVLGLVIERPGYGYQLGQRLAERCGAWDWESSGVYGALNSLQRDGYVRSSTEKGTGATGRAAPRAIYEATGAGVDYFRAWIIEFSPPSPVRQELDLKILFSGPECLPRLIEQTCAQEQRCIEAVEALTSSALPVVPGRRSRWREAAAVLQRDAEIKLLQVRVEWLQDARRVMKQILDESAGSLRVIRNG